MMDNGVYKDLSKKSPREAADIVGREYRQNYLAHTIRDIELAILLTQNKHYHIITVPSINRLSRIYFCKQGCEIWLTSDETNERKMRLILAHELGHLVHNIEKLKDMDYLNMICDRDKKNTANKDEEIYAWQFAFYLIAKKSSEYKEAIRKQEGKFVYKNKELEASMADILREDNPQILDDVMDSLKSKQ